MTSSMSSRLSPPPEVTKGLSPRSAGLYIAGMGCHSANSRPSTEKVQLSKESEDGSMSVARLEQSTDSPTI